MTDYSERLLTDYSEMSRDALLEEVKKRDIKYQGQPGEVKLREMLNENDDAGFIGPPPPLELDGLSPDDMAGEFDSTVSAGDFGRRAKNPFDGYPVRLLTVRRYPKSLVLERMSRDELLGYCAMNDLIHKGWIVKRSTDIKAKDQHEYIVDIQTGDGWDEEKILAFIDRRQTFRIPTHHLVFTNLPPTKPTVPHTIALKSWYTKRHENIWFDMAWPLPTPAKPYEEGKPNQCAIVHDDSMRAQMFFVRQVGTGKVVPRMIGRDSKVNSYFMFKEDERRSIGLLERIFRGGTKASKALQAWEKEEGGLPDLP